jgi:hypothetical protein
MSIHRTKVEALQGVLTDEVRKCAGTHLALIDWAIARDDIASAIAQARFSTNMRPTGRLRKTRL